MMPIGPLMIEHRLIEKMLVLVRQEARRVASGAEPNPELLRAALDFIRTYADRCHHGKEEDILFRDLDRKPLAPDHRAMMEELVREHVYARGLVRELAAATEGLLAGERSAEKAIATALERLADFYPEHIRKEDQEFFLPAMKYLSAVEQSAMLAEFWEFDRKLIHEKYKAVVEQFSGRKA